MTSAILQWWDLKHLISRSLVDSDGFLGSNVLAIYRYICSHSYFSIVESKVILIHMHAIIVIKKSG